MLKQHSADAHNFNRTSYSKGKFIMLTNLCRTEATWRMCFLSSQSYISDTSWIKFIPDVQVKNRD